MAKGQKQAEQTAKPLNTTESVDEQEVKQLNKTITGMQSFKSMIGGDAESIKNLRVSNFTETALAQSQMTIQQLQNEFREKQNDIEGMLDLGIENTQDVATNLKKIDTKVLFDKVYNAADQLAVVARKLKIRVEIHNRLFPENRVNGLTKEQLDFLAACV